MKVGADRKKIAILSGLALVLAYFLYTNVISPTPDVPASAPRASTPAAAPKSDPTDTVFQPPAQEVRPRPPLRPGAPSQVRFNARDRRKIDPTTVDPTLRTDLLAKVQAVTLEGGERNLFQFGPSPAQKVPEVKVPVKPVGPQPVPDQPVKPAEPVKPPPPPIPLKFFGYTSQRAGQKRAFFLDGDEIIVAVEGATIKNRYKVVRIGVNSVVIEDTQFQHQQTLPLEEPQQG